VYDVERWSGLYASRLSDVNERLDAWTTFSFFVYMYVIKANSRLH
jgi:hypothetical protein